MNLVKNKVCQSCAHIGTNIYGQYCTKASYRSSEYGSFFVGNVCIFDELNDIRKSLFEPVPNDTQAKLTASYLEINRLKRDHEEQINDLENTIHTLTKKKK